MSANAFDTLAASLELEESGIERPQVEAIAKKMRVAAGANRVCVLWIQAGALIGVLLAIATIIIGYAHRILAQAHRSTNNARSSGL